jgi:hypothetical protein
VALGVRDGAEEDEIAAMRAAACMRLRLICAEQTMGWLSDVRREPCDGRLTRAANLSPPPSPPLAQQTMWKLLKADDLASIQVRRGLPGSWPTGSWPTGAWLCWFGLVWV